jgi:hypothetical protein
MQFQGNVIEKIALSHGTVIFWRGARLAPQERACCQTRFTAKYVVLIGISYSIWNRCDSKYYCESYSTTFLSLLPRTKLQLLFYVSIDAWQTFLHHDFFRAPTPTSFNHSAGWIIIFGGRLLTAAATTLHFSVQPHSFELEKCRVSSLGINLMFGRLFCLISQKSHCLQ